MSVNKINLLSFNPKGEGYSSFLKNESDIWEKIRSELLNVNVLPINSQLLSYKEISPWERGGSETFICIILIKYLTQNNINITNKIIVKALVKEVVDLNKYSEQLLEKANLLKLNNIMTGTFGASKGCLYQKYFEKSFKDELVSNYAMCDMELLERNIRKFEKLCYKIGKMGFTPLSLLSDLRFYRNQIVLVDLGEDLGVAGEIQSILPVIQRGKLELNTLFANKKDQNLSRIISLFGKKYETV